MAPSCWSRKATTESSELRVYFNWDQLSHCWGDWVTEESCLLLVPVILRMDGALWGLLLILKCYALKKTKEYADEIRDKHCFCLVALMLSHSCIVDLIAVPCEHFRLWFVFPHIPSPPSHRMVSVPSTWLKEHLTGNDHSYILCMYDQRQIWNSVDTRFQVPWDKTLNRAFQGILCISLNSAFCAITAISAWPGHMDLLKDVDHSQCWSVHEYPLCWNWSVLYE